MASVYIIECRGHLKVGSAYVPEVRLRDMQICCPFEMQIIHQLNFGTRERAFVVEKLIHKDMGKQRVRGEWFKRRPVDPIERLEHYYQAHLQIAAEFGWNYSKVCALTLLAA